MKCQICKQRESVLHVQQIIGEEQVDMYLCDVCAREKGITKSDDSIELSLSQLLTGLFDESGGGAHVDEDKEICPVCGTSIHTFRKQGELGCPECYVSFSGELRSVQKKLTGSILHKGKIPGKLRAYKELIVDKHDLQVKLEEAVGNEDYETAARLRDQIREIDRQNHDSIR